MMETNLDLSTYPWPKLKDFERVFSTLNIPPELLKEATYRRHNLELGKEKFNELFFRGGKVKLQKGSIGTWKEDAWVYCQALMTSFEPKHQQKELVCAMIMQEVLILKEKKSYLEKIKSFFN